MKIFLKLFFMLVILSLVFCSCFPLNHNRYGDQGNRDQGERNHRHQQESRDQGERHDNSPYY